MLPMGNKNPDIGGDEGSLSKEAFIVEMVFAILKEGHWGCQRRYADRKNYKISRKTKWAALDSLKNDGYIMLKGKTWYPTAKLVRLLIHTNDRMGYVINGETKQKEHPSFSTTLTKKT